MAINEIKVKTVEELFARLNPLLPMWKGGDRMHWGFRGQREADWRLVPSAFREGVLTGFAGVVKKAPKDIESQCEAEWEVLHQFFHRADDVGLAVPGDAPAFRDLVAFKEEVKPSFNDLTWPRPSMLQTLAIAQHHGVPTRLLDFTHDPLKALFFAAIGAREATNRAGSMLALWAINLDFVHNAGWPWDRFGIVSAPYATNPFLFAQEGFFLVDRRANLLRQKTGKFIPFDQSFDEIDDAFRNWGRSDALSRLDIEDVAGPIRDLADGFLKIVVPTTLATDLLDVLDRRGVNLASLMPTFDNVVQSMKFRAKLR